MKKIIGSLLVGGSFALLSSQAFASVQTLMPETYASSHVLLLAAAQFSPDLVEKKTPLSTPQTENDHNTGTCLGYNYTVFNCLPPHVVSEPCQFNPKKFKKCSCNPQEYKYSAQNCVYTAQSPYYPDANRLLSDICRETENGMLTAKECKCQYFRFTTNASCGEEDKVIDTRSYCQQDNGEIRYESCRCNRDIYPHMFIGLPHSQAFKDEVKRVCGSEENFKSCQNFSNEIHYKCISSD